MLFKELKQFITPNMILLIIIILILYLNIDKTKDKFTNTDNNTLNDTNVNVNKDNDNNNVEEPELCGENGILNSTIVQLEENLKVETDKLEELNTLCDNQNSKNNVKNNVNNDENNDGNNNVNKNAWNLCQNREYSQKVISRLSDDLTYRTLDYCNACDDDLYKEKCLKLQEKLNNNANIHNSNNNSNDIVNNSVNNSVNNDVSQYAVVSEAERMAFEEQLRNKTAEANYDISNNERNNNNVDASNLTSISSQEYASLDDIGTILNQNNVNKNNILVVRDLLSNMGYNEEQIDTLMKNRPGNADTSLPFTQIKPADEDGIYLSKETNKIEDTTYDNIKMFDGLNRDSILKNNGSNSLQYQIAGNGNPPIIYQEEINGVSNIFAPNIIINNNPEPDYRMI